MDEQQKQQIIQALVSQGILGGGIGDLQPVWQKMNIESQMEGQAYPQYPEWYRMVQDMIRQGAGTPSYGPAR